MDHRFALPLRTIAAASLLALTLAAQSQTLPPGLENLDGNSSTNSPFSVATATSVIWQWCYDSTLFAHRGPMTITEMRIRGNVGGAVPAFDFPSVEIVMSTSPTGVGALSTTFATNLGGDATVVRGATPLTGPGTPANPLGPSPFIAVGLTTPFNYNPCMGDLIVQVRKCGLVTQWGATNLDGVTGVTALLHRIGHTTNCLNLTSNSTGAGFAPVLQIDYTPTGPASEPYETNDPFASIVLDGQQGTAIAPLIVRKCTGNFTRICIDTQITAFPVAWDLALTTAPPVAAPTCLSAGTGVVTPNGQKINLDLAAMDLGFVNGLEFTNIWSGKIFIPFQSFVPLAYTGQFFVVDPTHPDGVRLSAPARIEYTAPAPLPMAIGGPLSDDSFTTVSVGCVRFYGRTFTQIFPTSNGRVMLAGGDSNSGPETAGEILFDNPFFGFWCDLDPAAVGSGLITVSSPTPDTFRVSYGGIPYFGESTAITNTFACEINSATGEVILDGILGIQPHPAALPDAGDNGLVGVSAGVGNVVDAGVTAFSLGGPNAPLGPATAIYNHGLTNPSLAGAGVNTLRFIPIESGPNAGNYTWIGL